mmetsp:Transcript_7375/g.17644  ORF Transcript_7375/g.17644 Transcript_7375/m.17644 type:complete len:306 (-) Transcript_7375:70-987(-)
MTTRCRSTSLCERLRRVSSDLDAMAEVLASQTEPLPPGTNASGVWGQLSDRVDRFLAEGYESVPDVVDPGGGADGRRMGRGGRKRALMEQVVYVLLDVVLGRWMKEGRGVERITVVDVGCGVGDLGLLVGYLFPAWRVVFVDSRPQSLSVVHRRAAGVGAGSYAAWCGDFGEWGTISGPPPPESGWDFDLAMGTGLCGHTADTVSRAAIARGAGFVVSWCCDALALDDARGVVTPRSRALAAHYTAVDYAAVVASNHPARGALVAADRFMHLAELPGAHRPSLLPLRRTRSPQFLLASPGPPPTL